MKLLGELVLVLAIGLGWLILLARLVCHAQMTPRPVQHTGGSNARCPRAHTLPRDPVSACLPPTPLHRCIGLRVPSLNDPLEGAWRYLAWTWWACSPCFSCGTP